MMAVAVAVWLKSIWVESVYHTQQQETLTAGFTSEAT